MYPAVAESCNEESGFDEDLQTFVDEYVGLWLTSSIEPPDSGKTYSAVDQGANEKETVQLIDSMEKGLRKFPASQSQQSAWRGSMFALLRQFAARSVCFSERHCSIIFSKEYFEATRAFVHRGQAFDPGLDTAALAQALRNIWVANCLQMFLGRQPLLTPSIFAYSMLYPYTDNYLDCPSRLITAKETACRKLGLRLSGQPVIIEDSYDSAVFRLVGMIEDEFPRALFPQVYSSLFAIHAAQVQSLRQQSASAVLDRRQLLNISVSKGGTSVLADGWLAAGRLSRAEARFFFGFGVMLQLMDDLQDLLEDRTAGHRTLLTDAAATGQFSRLTNRLWFFVQSVLDSTDCFTDPQGLELRDLIRNNSIMLILRAIAKCANLYPEDYVCHMERFSPLSFRFLRDNSQEVKIRLKKIWPSLARRRKLRSIFDLLG